MHTDNEIRQLDDAELNAVGGGSAWSDVGYTVFYGIGEAISAIASIPVSSEILLLI